MQTKQAAPARRDRFEREEFDAVSILDSDFDSAWAPPVTLATEQTAPVLLDSWRAERKGVRA